MIGKVMKRGKSIGGLTAYLFGRGKANEHTDQRVIAADEALDLPDGTRLDQPGDWPTVRRIGRAMDAHRRLAAISPDKGWVWHCALSLPPGENLTDEQWAQAARTVVDELEFTGDLDTGRAACPWIAVHHGPSAEGNDHIHIAVNLIREDGTDATPYYDYSAVQRICATLESRFGLSVVEGRTNGGLPSISRAELTRVASGERCEPDRLTLARHVRAAELLAADESAFVSELTAAGILLQPRYGPGKTSVTGYSVALPPTPGRKPVWYGGGKLAADLTLPRLRSAWPADPAHAVDAWTAAHNRTHTPQPGPASPPLVEGDPAAAWTGAAAQVDAVTRHLRTVPATDTVTLARAARETAAVYAVLWTRIERPEPGPLAAAVDALAYSAQTRARPRRQPHSRQMRRAGHIARTAPLSGSAAADMWIKLVRSLIRLLETLYELHRARAQARRAAALAAAGRAQLARVAQHQPIDPELAEIRRVIALQSQISSQELLRRGSAQSVPSPLPRQQAPSYGVSR